MATTQTPASVHPLPVGRAFFADERGVMLRTTWHLDRGFLNMSIWHDDTCVATFQLQVTDAARLASFLVEGLGEATATLVAAQRTAVAAVAESPTPASPTPGQSGAEIVTELARAVGSAAGAVATKLRTVWRGR